MSIHADLPSLVVATHPQHTTANKRLMKRLRAAEARHRIELLREEQVLNEHLADVWDEDFIGHRKRVS